MAGQRWSIARSRLTALTPVARHAHTFRSSHRYVLHLHPTKITSRCRVAHVFRVSAISAADVYSTGISQTIEYEFACPICLTERLVVMRSRQRLQTPSAPTCPRCKRTFSATGVYTDLLVTSGAPPKIYNQALAASVELFRNPAVSFVYERGWRQGFSSAGFPGADKEFAEAMAYFRPVLGGTLLDLSCGSGLFTRRFIKSVAFSRVIAADFSESMLAQTQQYIAEDVTIQPASYCLVRADAGRLPFASGTLDAIHAGAAIHCWPQPLTALAEISRVLKPGGVFVGTTFMGALAPLGEALGEDFVRPLARVVDPLLDPRRRTGMKAWEESELNELCETVGLVQFQRQRRSRYIMFTATKPL